MTLCTMCRQVPTSRADGLCSPCRMGSVASEEIQRPSEDPPEWRRTVEKSLRTVDDQVAAVERTSEAIPGVKVDGGAWDAAMGKTMQNETCDSCGYEPGGHDPKCAYRRSETAPTETDYEVRFVEESSLYGDYTALKILRNGEVIGDHSDRGEPEDQSFGRDWSWVAPALRQAYAFGVEDGGSAGGDADDLVRKVQAVLDGEIVPDWLRPLLCEVRGALRRRPTATAKTKSDGEWIDYACRCCKAKPQHAWWKFCPYCGTSIPTEARS